jgi:hypothetical protein
MEDCDSNQAQSLCCKTLEGADEDSSVAHTSHNDAWGTPVHRKMKGKEKNTQIDKVFNFLKRKHLLDATEHIFLGFAKIQTTFSPERRGVVKNENCSNNVGREDKACQRAVTDAGKQSSLIHCLFCHLRDNIHS